MSRLIPAGFALLIPLVLGASQAWASATAISPAAAVNPLIGSSNGGNTFPGPMLPFGMLQWSPETTRGKHNRTAAPGGYAYDHPRVRGFALTHLSGTGCAGASGDIPFMPITTAV
ncbi:MAG: glycoside hydrolase family 92 protein, partial [Rhodanobacter sp.]